MGGGFICDIKGEQSTVGACLPNLGQGIFCFLGIGSVINIDKAAGAGQTDGDRPANATAPTGYQCHFTKGGVGSHRLSVPLHKGGCVYLNSYGFTLSFGVFRFTHNQRHEF